MSWSFKYKGPVREAQHGIALASQEAIKSNPNAKDHINGLSRTMSNAVEALSHEGEVTVSANGHCPDDPIGSGEGFSFEAKLVVSVPKAKKE